MNTKLQPVTKDFDRIRKQLEEQFRYQFGTGMGMWGCVTIRKKVRKPVALLVRNNVFIPLSMILIVFEDSFSNQDWSLYLGFVQQMVQRQS